MHNNYFIRTSFRTRNFTISYSKKILYCIPIPSNSKHFMNGSMNLAIRALYDLVSIYLKKNWKIFFDSSQSILSEILYHFCDIKGAITLLSPLRLYWKKHERQLRGIKHSRHSRFLTECMITQHIINSSVNRSSLVSDLHSNRKIWLSDHWAKKYAPSMKIKSDLSDFRSLFPTKLLVVFSKSFWK